MAASFPYPLSHLSTLYTTVLLKVSDSLARTNQKLLFLNSIFILEEISTPVSSMSKLGSLVA